MVEFALGVMAFVGMVLAICTLILIGLKLYDMYKGGE